MVETAVTVETGVTVEAAVTGETMTGETVVRGGFRILKRGGTISYCEHDNCVQSTQSGMQSMPNLGGSDYRRLPVPMGT